MWKMLLVALGLPAVAVAGAPAHVPVQARLLNASGVPIEAPVDVTFSLYTQPSGGASLYTETRSVDPQSGYFSIFVGEVTPLDWSVVDGSSPLYVGMAIDGAAEFGRQPVGTVPFAAYADQAASAGDAETLEGLTVADVVAEVQTTYPEIATPYTDSDAVAAVEAAHPSVSDPYEDGDAVSAVVSAHPSIGQHYDDSDAVAAMGSLGPTNALNHSRYSDSEALAAMGALSNSNPRHHARYSDSDARSTISAEGRYLLDTTDTLTGNLTVSADVNVGDDVVVTDNILFGGTIRDTDSSIASRLIKMSFARGTGATSGRLQFTDADGNSHEIMINGGATSNSHLAWIPGTGGADGRLLFNIESAPTGACTLLHNDDDQPKAGFYFATDGGNSNPTVWGNSSTNTFILAREGVATAPITDAQSFVIMCF